MKSELPYFCIDFQLCQPSCGPYTEKKVEEVTEGAVEGRSLNGESGRAPGWLPHDPFCKPIPTMVKSLHDDLNTRILRRSIDRSFAVTAEDFTSKPEKSFKILSRIADIAQKVCAGGGVDMRFLAAGVDLFQTAHEGRGFYFHETFTTKDFKFIMDVLDGCYNDVERLVFKRTDCEGVVSDEKHFT